jgi:hypothetical protein
MLSPNNIPHIGLKWFASLCSLAGRYVNPIPTRFLAPHRLFKLQALELKEDSWMLKKSQDLF